MTALLTVVFLMAGAIGLSILAHIWVWAAKLVADLASARPAGRQKRDAAA